jgi:hypothetical protein
MSEQVSCNGLQELFDEHLRVRIELEELLMREQELMTELAEKLRNVPLAERERSIRDFVRRAGRNIAAELD